MPGDEKALWVHLRAYALCNSQNDASQKRTSKCTTTNDDRFKSEDQLVGAGEGIKGGPHR